ncbi:MAG: hypothetical protein E7000_01685 [Coriobacteriaceae bacterium]|nr:hypothetical protein [Coriobacteriaceae bacterium]
MLQSLFIQNFRAWENQTFTFNGEHVVFAGGTDSGKSSVLQALDLFFNRDTIDSTQVRDPSKDVAIGIRYDGTTFKKTFSHKTHQVKSRTPAADWKKVEAIHYIYLPATNKTSATILTELAQAKADSLLPPHLADELAAVAKHAMDEVLSVVGTAETKRNSPVTAVPRVKPARAVDFTILNNGVPVAGAELGYSKNLTYAMLVGSQYDNVVLGIDDMEHAFASMDYQKVIRSLEQHVGQVLMTTRSSQVMKHMGREVTVPVGSNPDGNMATILRGLEGQGKAFLLVEGKYDLPWYKEAAELSGFGNRVNILPAGGTNIDELRREMAGVGMKCVAIVDGDTAPDERTGKYALVRDCVELYAPDDLLQELFGTVPPKADKHAFFASVQAAKPASENGIKAAIAENIAAHLTPHSEFVREVGTILKRALES